jgi:hypothetical protein
MRAREQQKYIEWNLVSRMRDKFVKPNVTNKLIEIMVEFKRLGMKVTYTNCIHEEITRKLSWGTSCCYANKIFCLSFLYLKI